jgi:hypothetical protein
MRAATDESSALFRSIPLGVLQGIFSHTFKINGKSSESSVWLILSWRTVSKWFYRALTEHREFWLNVVMTKDERLTIGQVNPTATMVKGFLKFAKDQAVLSLERKTAVLEVKVISERGKLERAESNLKLHKKELLRCTLMLKRWGEGARLCYIPKADSHITADGGFEEDEVFDYSSPEKKSRKKLFSDDDE